MPEPDVYQATEEEARTAGENVGENGAPAGSAANSEQLASEKAELQDLLLRRQAEFDNFRRRTERERAEWVQFAGMELVREMLPIVDDFNRAVKADASGRDYAKGVEMIHQRMLETLKKSGLEPIESQGKPFDPHLHQAVERVHSDDTPDNTVLDEFQKGYFFKGKLLRPAMVKVAVQS